MRVFEDNGIVTGYIDCDGGGETDVITLHVDFGVIKVASSVCLPVDHKQAKLVLACMTEAFRLAEYIA